MAINFPSSPTEGQKFIQGTAAYTFTGGVWSAAQLGTALPFNYIVNPAIQISQEAGRSHSSVNGHYPADQWQYSSDVPSASGYSGAGNPNYVGIASNLAFTPTTTSLAYITQLIEGTRVADLQWGTANAKQAVFNFKARFIGASGVPFIFGASLRNHNPDYDRSFAQDFTITVLNTWQEFSMAVPGPTTGTWFTDTNAGMALFFTAMSGATYRTPTPGAWANGNYIAGPNISNLFTGGSRAIEFADIGIYADPDYTGRAPPWQSVTEQRAHLDSLRFWTKHESMRGVSAGAGVSRAGGHNVVYMRAAPALAIVGGVYAWDQATSGTVTSLSGAYGNIHYPETEAAVSATLTTGRPAFFPPSAMPSDYYLTASARF
jgi:hypothetical protein